MQRLQRKYGVEAMRTVRASRVDYYTQHDVEVWRDHLLSLNLEGEDCVFVNLGISIGNSSTCTTSGEMTNFILLHFHTAAIAGPVAGKPDAMMDVNYKAPIAAARACEYLKFGHWVQSSTQATSAERAGQVIPTKYFDSDTILPSASAYSSFATPIFPTFSYSIGAVLQRQSYGRLSPFSA
jgi:hypothetical protein